MVSCGRSRRISQQAKFVQESNDVFGAQGCKLDAALWKGRANVVFGALLGTSRWRRELLVNEQANGTGERDGRIEDGMQEVKGQEQWAGMGSSGMGLVERRRENEYNDGMR